jgi:hypothetical protein
MSCSDHTQRLRIHMLLWKEVAGWWMNWTEKLFAMINTLLFNSSKLCLVQVHWNQGLISVLVLCTVSWAVLVFVQLQNKHCLSDQTPNWHNWLYHTGVPKSIKIVEGSLLDPKQQRMAGWGSRFRIIQTWPERFMSSSQIRRENFAVYLLLPRLCSRCCWNVFDFLPGSMLIIWLLLVAFLLRWNMMPALNSQYCNSANLPNRQRYVSFRGKLLSCNDINRSPGIMAVVYRVSHKVH